MAELKACLYRFLDALSGKFLRLFSAQLGEYPLQIDQRDSPGFCRQHIHDCANGITNHMQGRQWEPRQYVQGEFDNRSLQGVDRSALQSLFRVKTIILAQWILTA